MGSSGAERLSTRTDLLGFLAVPQVWNAASLVGRDHVRGHGGATDHVRSILDSQPRTTTCRRICHRCRDRADCAHVVVSPRDPLTRCISPRTRCLPGEQKRPPACALLLLGSDCRHSDSCEAAKCRYCGAGVRSHCRRATAGARRASRCCASRHSDRLSRRMVRFGAFVRRSTSVGCFGCRSRARLHRSHVRRTGRTDLRVPCRGDNSREPHRVCSPFRGAHFVSSYRHLDWGQLDRTMGDRERGVRSS